MYKKYLDQVAQDFINAIKKSKDVKEIPTEDYGWGNWRYESAHFRLAHVERYSDSKLEVLHVTTFPHKWSPEPIFGFDVITTDSKPLGCYMDFTPVLKNYDIDYGNNWTVNKQLPEWATAFSEQFLLVSPQNDEELTKFCDVGLVKYTGYIMNILELESKDDEGMISEIQNYYCEMQSNNPRTMNVLKNKIGEEKAQFFMKEVLFPKIK